MKRQFLFLLILIGCLTCLSLTGCDSQLEVTGTVYEWLNAPQGEMGVVLIDEEPPAEYALQPIDDVIVGFYAEEGWSLLSACSKIRREENYRPLRGRYPTPEDTVISSNSSGEFNGFWIIGGGKYNMKIVAEKAGYYPVEKIFPFDGGYPIKPRFSIIMVRQP